MPRFVFHLLSISWVLLLLPFSLFAQKELALAHAVKAQKFRGHRDVSSALAEFQKAIRADPNNASYYTEVGKCYYELKMLAEATDAFEKATRLKKDAESFHKLAYLYGQRGMFNKRIEALNQAAMFEVTPKRCAACKLKIIEELYQRNRFSEANQHIQEALPLAQHEPEIHYFAAREANRRGDYNQAIQHTNRVLSRLPENVRSEELAKYYYQRGVAYYQLGDYASANSSLMRANYGPYRKKVERLSPGYHYMLAKAYYAVGDEAEALKASEHALKINPAYSHAQTLIKKIYTDKSYNDAYFETQLRRINAISDPNTKAKQLGMLAEYFMRAGRFAQATEASNKALQQLPRNYNFSFTLAVASFRTGEYQKALEVLNQLVHYRALDAETRAKFYFLKGLTHKKLAQKKEAQAAFYKARVGKFDRAAEALLRG